MSVHILLEALRNEIYSGFRVDYFLQVNFLNFTVSTLCMQFFCNLWKRKKKKRNKKSSRSKVWKWPDSKNYLDCVKMADEAQAHFSCPTSNPFKKNSSYNQKHFLYLTHYRCLVLRVSPPCKSGKSSSTFWKVFFPVFLFVFYVDCILIFQQFLLFHVLLIQLLVALINFQLTFSLNF